MKTLLVVVYLSTTGQLDMRDYPMPDMSTCKAKAQAIHANVKAGKANVICWRV